MFSRRSDAATIIVSLSVFLSFFIVFLPSFFLSFLLSFHSSFLFQFHPSVHTSFLQPSALRSRLFLLHYFSSSLSNNLTSKIFLMCIIYIIHRTSSRTQTVQFLPYSIGCCHACWTRFSR